MTNQQGVGLWPGDSEGRDAGWGWSRNGAKGQIEFYLLSMVD
jgi:hypothetical protein